MKQITVSNDKYKNIVMEIFAKRYPQSYKDYMKKQEQKVNNPFGRLTL